jgi:hypothetical protein
MTDQDLVHIHQDHIQRALEEVDRPGPTTREDINQFCTNLNRVSTEKQIVNLRTRPLNQMHQMLANSLNAGLQQQQLSVQDKPVIRKPSKHSDSSDLRGRLAWGF